MDTGHAAGCDSVACGSYDADAIMKAVGGAQLVVVCLGLGTHSCCSSLSFTVSGLSLTCARSMVDG